MLARAFSTPRSPITSQPRESKTSTRPTAIIGRPNLAAMSVKLPSDTFGRLGVMTGASMTGAAAGCAVGWAAALRSGTTNGVLQVGQFTVWRKCASVTWSRCPFGHCAS